MRSLRRIERAGANVAADALEMLRAGHVEQVVTAAAEVANSLGTAERAALAAGAAAAGSR